MEKPVEPIQPQPIDFPIEDGFVTANSTFIIAYKKWEKYLAKFQEDMELYNQTKMIKDIKRSTLKLSLKKYKVMKK